MEDDETIIEASHHISPYPRSPTTTMTSFIHHCRLKRIESEIQHTIYRVDKPVSSSYEVIQEFLDRLISWKEHLPVECYTVQDNDIQPFEGIVVYASSPYVFSNNLLTDLDGALQQNCAPPLISSALKHTCKHALPAALCRSLRRCLHYL